MNYYQKKFFLSAVDKNDQIIGQIERWQAHREKILHRGFTVILIYQNKIILQKRRHPVFDGYWDISFSSHPIYRNNQLESMEEAIIKNLKREWITKEKKFNQLKFINKYYYLAKDPKSHLYEHEVNYLYRLTLSLPIDINPKFAYEKAEIDINQNKLLKKFQPLVPWVKKISIMTLLLE